MAANKHSIGDYIGATLAMGLLVAVFFTALGAFAHAAYSLFLIGWRLF